MNHDPWCVCYECGLFDLICEEGESWIPCEAYVRANSHLYDKPLRIILKSQVRQMVYINSVMFIGIGVRMPGEDII